MKFICKKDLVIYSSVCIIKADESCYSSYENDDEILINKIWFSKKKNSLYFSYIYDYFYTVQELRKIKIDKLLDGSLL